MEEQSEVKGVVIITLPPPDDPNAKKTLTAFSLTSPLDHHQQQPYLSQNEDLPLYTRPLPPPRRRRFSRAASRHRRLLVFLLAAFLGIAFWQFAPSSLNWLQSDPENRSPHRSVVLPLYTKTQQDSQATIAKLVERDALRNRISALNGSSSTAFPVRGNVYPHGIYYISLSLGTPARPYYLDVDTGSDLTWLQCDAPCVNCAKGPHPPYKPKKTQLVSCNEPICLYVQEGSALGNADGCSQCDYEIKYADGASTLGVLVSDTTNLMLTNGTLVQPRTVFGCSYDQQGSLALSPAATDGVLGLSSSPSSLLSQWAELGIVKNVVSHCIAGSGKSEGYLFFGDDLVPFWGMTWAPMIGKPSEKNYHLRIQKIHFGNGAVSMDATLVGATHGVAIFDSGTSYTYFVPQLYKAFLSVFLGDAFSNGLKQDPLDPTLPICLKGSVPFRSIEEVSQLFKDVFLDFKGDGWFSKSRKFRIPPEGYLIVNSKGNLCLGILDAGTLGQKIPNIIGDISLRGYLVVYDNANNRLGWMKTDCRKPPSAITPFL